MIEEQEDMLGLDDTDDEYENEINEGSQVLKRTGQRYMLKIDHWYEARLIEKLEEGQDYWTL